MTCTICSLAPVFRFTGASKNGPRKELEQIIANNGGIFKNTVTKATDYLIVGNDGNPCWAFSCYGRKVEKAIELRKSGSNMLIVHEDDFWKALSTPGTVKL